MEGGMRMVDREKVIDGLKHCVPETIKDGMLDYSTCPYQNACKTGGTISLPIRMIEDIRTLLKEQEAVEPLPQNSNGWVRTIKLWYCGACHSKISRRSSKYCPNCGKPILWEGR